MAANDYSHLRGKTADHSITTDYAAIMETFKDETTWFRKARMSLESQEIAAEIIRLELLQSRGEVEYTITETVERVRPIGPRLRELHQQLADTGKGPLTGMSTMITVVDGVDELDDGYRQGSEG